MKDDFKSCPKCGRKYKRQDNYDIHAASQTHATIDSQEPEKAAAESRRDSKGPRPHEREAADFRPITRNADKLYEAQSGWRQAQLLFVIRSTARAIVCRQSKSLDPKRLRLFLDGEGAGWRNDEYYFYRHAEARQQGYDMLDVAFGMPVDHVDPSVDVREKQPPKIKS